MTRYAHATYATAEDERAAAMSDIEREFETYWRLFAPGAPQPEHDVEFCPDRRWRADFMWQEYGVIVECEGGVYTGQAHGSVSGILRDIEKYNAANSLGYRVFRYGPKQREDPQRFAKKVLVALARQRRVETI